jgi:hypothetical protein
MAALDHVATRRRPARSARLNRIIARLLSIPARLPTPGNRRLSGPLLATDIDCEARRADFTLRAGNYSYRNDW